jgi:hypothetical protein
VAAPAGRASFALASSAVAGHLAQVQAEPKPLPYRGRADRGGQPMTGEHEFQPGEIIRIALPDSDEDLQFIISDVRDDGGAETVSLIPDPENADAPLPWE